MVKLWKKSFEKKLNKMLILNTIDPGILSLIYGHRPLSQILMQPFLWVCQIIAMAGMMKTRMDKLKLLTFRYYKGFTFNWIYAFINYTLWFQLPFPSIRKKYRPDKSSTIKRSSFKGWMVHQNRSLINRFPKTHYHHHLLLHFFTLNVHFPYLNDQQKLATVLTAKLLTDFSFYKVLIFYLDFIYISNLMAFGTSWRRNPLKRWILIQLHVANRIAFHWRNKEELD